MLPAAGPLRNAVMLALGLVASSCAAPGRAPASDGAAVRAAVHAFHASLAAGDAQAAARLLAPDAVVLEGGEREGREAYLGHHLAADIAFAQAAPARRSDVDVTVQGDVAWAVSTSVVPGTGRAKPGPLAGAELMVLSRTAAGWRIRAIHWSSRSAR